MNQPCPLELICAQMGLQTNNQCHNLLTCEAAELAGVDNVDNSEAYDDEPKDDLSDQNPSLTRTYYRKSRYSNEMDERSGWFWIVREDRTLPTGYASAVDANLAAHRDGNCLNVVQNRTVDAGEYGIAVPNPSFFFEIDGTPIVLIEWLESKHGYTPYQIHTEESNWMCHECNDGTLLCTPDDAPIESNYWLRDDQPHPKTFGTDVRRVPFPQGLELLRLKTLLEKSLTCDNTMYCTICKDQTYEANYGWSNCEHLRYINYLESWGGAGYDEDDLGDDYATSLALLATNPIAPTLRSLIEKQHWSGIMWEIRSLDEDNLEPAIALLETLSDKTPEASKQCLQWLNPSTG